MVSGKLGIVETELEWGGFSMFQTMFDINPSTYYKECPF